MGGGGGISYITAPLQESTESKYGGSTFNCGMRSKILYIADEENISTTTQSSRKHMNQQSDDFEMGDWKVFNGP